MNGQILQVVDKFTDLGNILSRTVHIDGEVITRTAKVSVAFGRLRTNVLERNGIRLDTKLKVYKIVVLPTLLSACETWKLAQLRWTGHVTRMPDERQPNKVFYGKLQEGKHSQGGQTKRS